MLKATANIAIKTCHFPKLVPAPPLLVLRGEEYGPGGFGGGLPTSSCFLEQVFVLRASAPHTVRELGITAGKEAGRVFSPWGEFNSLGKRNMPSRAGGHKVVEGEWEVTSAETFQRLPKCHSGQMIFQDRGGER